LHFLNGKRFTEKSSVAFPEPQQGHLREVIGSGTLKKIAIEKCF